MGKRLITLVVAVLAILVLTSSAALAHVCINVSRSATGTAGAAASEGWLSLEELIELLSAEGELPPLCQAGIDHIVSEVDPDGTFATHAKVVVASGRVESNFDLSGDGKGIDHLFHPNHADVLAAFESALEEALGICAAS